MKQFMYGDEVETVLGKGIFQEYAYGGLYKVLIPDQGILSFQKILNEGRKEIKPTELESKYAPYVGNEKIFDAPFNPHKEPKLLKKFMEQTSKWILVVGSSLDSIESTAKELLQAGLSTPRDYIRQYDGGHGTKYDLLVPDPNMPGIDLALGLYFNPIRLRQGFYQIGRTEFALYVLPHVRVLEVGEKIGGI